MSEVTSNALFTELTEEETSILNGGGRKRHRKGRREGRRVCKVAFVRVCRRVGWFVQCIFVRQIRCFNV
jgi:hypothetical protein